MGCGWSWWVVCGEALCVGLRPVCCHSLVKHKMLNQEQLWPVLIASVTAWKNQTIKHIIEERFYILSVWYLKQTICFLISVRIREGRFSLAGFIFFGKEWQAKIRLDPENFKGSIRNRQQIFLCVFLPKPSLQSFQLFSLAIWDLSSPSPRAFLLFPFWLLSYDLTFAVLLNMSLLWLLLYQLRASSISLPL